MLVSIYRIRRQINRRRMQTTNPKLPGPMHMAGLVRKVPLSGVAISVTDDATPSGL